jgi:glycosyltransferase involved in cell wall biosynthesis
LLLICDDLRGFRPSRFCAYLPEFGWQPYVLSLREDPADPYGTLAGAPPVTWVDWREHPVAGRPLALGERLHGFVCTEECRPPGLLAAMQDAMETLPNAKPDAVFATTSTVMGILRTARDFAVPRGIPWIADLRDILEQRPPGNSTWRERFYVRRAIARRSQLLRSAAAQVTISDWHRNRLQACGGPAAHVIYNGFCPERFAAANIAPPDRDRFRITYAGSMLDRATRDPTVFFAAMDRLLADGALDPAVCDLDFYGPDSEQVATDYAAFTSSQLVRAHTMRPQDEMPGVLGRSSLLLLLTSDKTHGVMTSKFYEYLACRRAIICVPRDDGSLASVIDRLQAGLATSDVDALARFIGTRYRQWQDGADLATPQTATELEPFNRRCQARQLAALLTAAVDG